MKTRGILLSEEPFVLGSKPRPSRSTFGWLAAVLSIALHAAASTGLLPNPAWLAHSAASIGGDPYPCQGGSCACRSARQCWTTCRCHSDADKIRWARANNVQIPRYATIDRTAISNNTPAPPACPLCASHEKRLTEQDPEPPAHPAILPPGCRGLEIVLAFSPVVTSLDIAPRPDPDPPFCLGLANGDEPTPDSITLDITPPPPRAEAALISISSVVQRSRAHPARRGMPCPCARTAPSRSSNSLSPSR